jgi:hypothetical protein
MINKALLTEHLKRFWAVPALAALVYLLAVFLPLHDNNPWGTMRQLVNIIVMINPIMIFVMVITPVITAFCTFGCFFNKKSVTAFYSMPLNKKQLFCTNALAGIILSLLPVLFFCILLLFPIPYHGEIGIQMQENSINHGADVFPFSPQGNLPLTLLPDGGTVGAGLNTFPIIAGLFLRMALATVFYFAVAWLGFSLAGHGFIGLLIVGVLPFVPIAFVGLTELIVQYYVFGLRTLISGTAAEAFFVYHNPALWGLLISRDYIYDITGAVLIPVLVYIVLTAAMLVGAYFISRRRKPERTGNSVVFNPVKNVLVFFVAMGGMFIVAAIMYSTNESIFMMHVGMLIGFAAGYFIAQMIAEKTFHVLGKLKFLPHFTGVAAGIYITVILVTQFGVGFYVNRVPDKDEIYGIYATTSWMTVPDEQLPRMVSTDPEIIAKTQEMHRLILQNKDSLWKIPNINSHGAYEGFRNGVFSSRENLVVKYLLNNGRIVTRQYNLHNTFIENTAMEDYLNSREIILMPFFLMRNPEYIRGVNLSFWSGGLNEEGEWTSWREAAEVTEQTQLDTILELIADATVETVIQRRNAEWWIQNDRNSRRMSVEVWFDTGRHRDTLPNFARWNVPRIEGEPVERLLEQLREWDLMAEE